MEKWFEEAKLGIFIHYGIYAVGDVSESWSFHNGNISYDDYMKQCAGFTAENFDADAWADLIVNSGAKYAVLTTKHHDGVALFDTKASNRSIIHLTPVKRDIVAEYSEALRKRNLKVGYYFSLIDWSREDYRSVYPEGTKEEDYSKQNPFSTPAGGPEDPDLWEAFLEFNTMQMEELLTNYGRVDLLWFDGDWERSAKQWKMREFKEFLLELNPNIICNSRMQGFGDYETPELGLPIRAPQGPWEFCTPINTSWGYRPSDHDYKSVLQIIRMFCDCITLGGNMLLDIGPKPDGTIDPRQEEVLLRLGEFIHDNEEAIYDTQKGLSYEFFLGGSTISQDKKTVYLFVYDTPKEYVCVKGINSTVKNVTIVHSGKKLEYHYTNGIPWSSVAGTMWMKLEEKDMYPTVTVLKIELEQELELYYGHGIVVSQND